MFLRRSKGPRLLVMELDLSRPDPITLREFDNGVEAWRCYNAALRQDREAAIFRRSTNGRWSILSRQLTMATTGLTTRVAAK